MRIGSRDAVDVRQTARLDALIENGWRDPEPSEQLPGQAPSHGFRPGTVHTSVVGGERCGQNIAAHNAVTRGERARSCYGPIDPPTVMGIGADEPQRRITVCERQIDHRVLAVIEATPFGVT